MHLKSRLTRWIAHRIETRARHQRHALRDYQRRESSQIQELEKRSRSLRLYAAWLVRKPVRIVEAPARHWPNAVPYTA
jgi:hypothetical protein